jgi:hypothetical protein
MTDDLIGRAVPILSQAATRLAQELHLIRPTLADSPSEA